MSVTPTERLSRFEQYLATQLFFLILTVIGGIGVWIVGLIWPTFFQYRFLYLTDHFLQDVMRFWPAFLWAALLNLGIGIIYRFRSTAYDERFLNQGIITSVGAGVTEELWFRGVGVFYAMLGVILSNFVFSAMSWVVMAFCAIGILGCVATLFIGRTEVTFIGVIGRILIALLCAAVLYGLVHYARDPVYQVYQHIFYPIINFLSFGQMGSVLYGHAQPLLVMGMVSANFWFRDGHKYQGLLGWTNSWWLGCVFIFATLTYGLPVAIAVHIILDITVDFTVYGCRKVLG